jgi:hypothetical protein
VELLSYPLRRPAAGRAIRAALGASASVLAALASAAALAQGIALEQAVKATYLYKIAAFVEWPAGAFDSPTAPVVICVTGGDPVGAVVEEAASGQRANGREFEVRRLAAGASSAGCHMLYMPVQGAATASRLGAARGTPVLTVTDAAREAGGQGIINFVTVDNRVRFEIDLRSAAENQLEISSKLLNVASKVRPRT